MFTLHAAGITGTKAKVEYLRNAGMWLLDEQGRLPPPEEPPPPAEQPKGDAVQGAALPDSVV